MFNVAVPPLLKVPVPEGVLVKAFTVILVPGPVKVVELGKVTAKVELALPDKLKPAAFPVAVEDNVTFVPVLLPAALMTTVPADVVGATLPNTKSAVFVIVTGAIIVTLLFAVAVAAWEIAGTIAETANKPSNTVEEERVLTLFMIVSSYLYSDFFTTKS
jgi:hypothetical protein